MLSEDDIIQVIQVSRRAFIGTVRKSEDAALTGRSFCRSSLSQVIQVLYSPASALSPQDQQNLNHQLLEAQKSDAAWGLIGPLLSHEVRSLDLCAILDTTGQTPKLQTS